MTDNVVKLRVLPGDALGGLPPEQTILLGQKGGNFTLTAPRVGVG